LNKAVKTGKLKTCDLILHLQTPRTYKASAAPLVGLGNDCILFTLIDVSAEIDAEKSRSTFVANVSHELRSPLTSLMGIVETLQGPARDDVKARANFLNLMQGETERMSRLVGDLLSLSKLEAKEHLPPDGQVDITKLLRRIMTVLSESKSAYKNRVSLDVPEDLPPIVGDADELTEVFQNLIENALKYSEPKSIVAVSAVQSTDSITITINDEGEGIAPEHLPHLTERFYRVDKGRSREAGGTGLGLAITKHILNRHRGRLSIKSKVGVGSEVSVTLPN
ncbi:MAG: GHKL domain-containing protein, partial [Robiginitomaculum sp.]|nr:GHKL domain-containing protein [Robiginitomaculum sp.]